MRIQVWDLPTRLFHWSLAISVSMALITGLVGGNWMVWHGRIGLVVVGLLAFRLAWGFVGSTHARFSDFFPTPQRLSDYVRGAWSRHGHSPLGGLSVLALLMVLSVQVGLGLFSNDDIAFDGPLYGLVDKSTSDAMVGWHRQGLWVIVGLVALHVLAIGFYGLARGKNLVAPMLRGWKEADDAVTTSGGGPAALVFALILAGAAVWFASGAWIPEPEPIPPAALPAW